MAPPLCQRCGVVQCAELASTSLRHAWRFEEGLKWTWSSRTQARGSVHKAAGGERRLCSPPWSSKRVLASVGFFRVRHSCLRAPRLPLVAPPK
eukprot:2266578-Pyramimonas_sp.AAC.1